MPGPRRALEETFDASRLAPILTELEVNFGTDDEGDLYADWDGLRLWFLARGDRQEVLALQMLWDIRPPADQFPLVLAVLNEWNRTRRIPKAYAATESDGTFAVGGTMGIDLETGASDAFLRQQLGAFIGTSLSFQEYLAAKLPESVTWLDTGVPPSDE